MYEGTVYDVLSPDSLKTGSKVILLATYTEEDGWTPCLDGKGLLVEITGFPSISRAPYLKENELNFDFFELDVDYYVVVEEKRVRS